METQNATIKLKIRTIGKFSFFYKVFTDVMIRNSI